MLNEFSDSVNIYLYTKYINMYKNCTLYAIFRDGMYYMKQLANFYTYVIMYICHIQYHPGTFLSGVGTAAGWTMPMSTLIGDNKIQVTQCNSRVQTATAFFANMCAPGSLNYVFNPFGDNPDTACKQCFLDLTKRNPDRCSYKNMYGGSYGAIKCLKEGKNNDLAFVRHGDAARYAHNNGTNPSMFQLLCPDGKTKSVPDIKMTTLTGSSNASVKVLTADDPQCNWGKIPSRVLVTSLGQPKVRECTV